MGFASCSSSIGSIDFGSPGPKAAMLLMLVAVLFVFMGALELIRSRLLVRIARRVDEELSDETLRAVFVHALRHSPNVNSQPVRDLDSIRQFVGGPVIEI